MAHNIENGGVWPACTCSKTPPLIVQDSKIEPTPSLKTLRDEFAMSALTGVLAGYGGGDIYPQKLAKTCHEIADAMMIAREKK